ncbi:MAG: hypothetical protein KAJ06_09215 [Gammaproteobacteria bacterium]|nr:hypothetical protein [Gammaproteobacteria bacterium]
MGFKDTKFGKAFGKVAPMILGALGGPWGGLAEGVLTKLVGQDQAAIEKEIAAGNPEIFAKLQIAEIEFKKYMADLGIKEEELVYADVADARAMRISTKDWTPAILTGIALTFFFTLSFAVLYNLEIVQGDTKDFAFYLFGVASGWVTQGMSFFLGSSKGSKFKDELAARLSK